jgi:hypothetical protein
MDLDDRAPTVKELTLRAARLLGVDVLAAFTGFYPTPLRETAPHDE